MGAEVHIVRRQAMRKERTKKTEKLITRNCTETGHGYEELHRNWTRMWMLGVVEEALIFALRRLIWCEGGWERQEKAVTKVECGGEDGGHTGG